MLLMRERFVRRELETLEAAKVAQLSKSLGPKAAALKAMPEPTGGSSPGRYGAVGPGCCPLTKRPLLLLVRMW